MRDERLNGKRTRAVGGASDLLASLYSPPSLYSEVESRSGNVYWITGLAGAGKSTLARAWKNHLEQLGRRVIFLDGDEMRRAFGADHGYSVSDRKAMSFKYGALCKMLSSQAVDVVIATISMFKSVHAWNRENIPNYREILIDTPKDILVERNQKGLYQGESRHVAGFTQTIEWPVDPDLRLSGTESTAQQVVQLHKSFVDRSLAEKISLETLGYTKAETLFWLQDKLQRSKVMPLYFVERKRWEAEREVCVSEIFSKPWSDLPLIVRSSAQGEDSVQSSAAGMYESVLNVLGKNELADAVDGVISSYDRINGNDQVLIQPMVSDVDCSGVIFTRDPASGSPYYIATYDDVSGKTNTVTDGSSNNIRTLYCLRGAGEDNKFAKLFNAVQELETLCCSDALDIEFAINRLGQIYVLQVRPLVGVSEKICDSAEIFNRLALLEERVEGWLDRHPRLNGEKSLLGIMPDWNPAEIIGVRPKPLALSVYKKLVTDNIWAYQRHNYGYKNLRSFPLMLSLLGQPYIDTRVSFNSFIPQNVEEELAEKLVNYYISQLEARPSMHDKIEFDLVFSCYTLDLPQRLDELKEFGFSASERTKLQSSLRDLTNNIINPEHGLWIEDRKKISTLEKRQQEIMCSNLDAVAKVYWLLEDCKRYGTLPFAGLARAGFIAVQLLNSLVSLGIFSDSDRDGFMASVDTVGSQLQRDLQNQPFENVLAKYGHLRPGTYDITSPRYDENPSFYFSEIEDSAKVTNCLPDFSLTIDQISRLKGQLSEHKIDHDVLSFLNFIKEAIEGREHAKFVFTRSLSDVFSLIGDIGSEVNLERSDLSFLDINVFDKLYSGCFDIKEEFEGSIQCGIKAHEVTSKIILPPLITTPEDIFCFEISEDQPNFITHLSGGGHVVTDLNDESDMENSIVLIPSADPGYDWIFTKNISGFITMFGGANSHMAIRASELSIPAVIGAGESLFRRWCVQPRLHIDCQNRQVIAI